MRTSKKSKDITLARPEMPAHPIKRKASWQPRTGLARSKIGNAPETAYGRTGPSRRRDADMTLPTRPPTVFAAKFVRHVAGYALASLIDGGSAAPPTEPRRTPISLVASRNPQRELRHIPANWIAES